MKPHGAILAREHAVEHQRVEMDVEIERPTEALHDHGSAAAPIGDAVTARAAAEERADAYDTCRSRHVLWRLCNQLDISGDPGCSVISVEGSSMKRQSVITRTTRHVWRM
jgi:hypothetical protein